MGIMDTFGQFVQSDDDVAIEAGNQLIGDVIDLGMAGRDIGNGQPLYLIIRVITAFDGGAGAAGTTQFELASDSTADLATSRSTHLLTKVFAAATELTAGTTFCFPIPAAGASGENYERYLGMWITQAVEGEDDGFIEAYLSLDPVGNISYPDAVN
jgi:hypothetical protein